LNSLLKDVPLDQTVLDDYVKIVSNREETVGSYNAESVVEHPLDTSVCMVL